MSQLGKDSGSKLRDLDAAQVTHPLNTRKVDVSYLEKEIQTPMARGWST